MAAESIELARQVLVDGRRQIDVAAESGLGKQWISLLVRKMLRYASQPDDIPPGWKSDVVVLPPKLWPAVRKLERDARAALKKTKK